MLLSDPYTPHPFAYPCQPCRKYYHKIQEISNSTSFAHKAMLASTNKIPGNGIDMIICTFL